jgi:hypothetical protein
VGIAVDVVDEQVQVRAHLGLRVQATAGVVQVDMPRPVQAGILGSAQHIQRARGLIFGRSATEGCLRLLQREQGGPLITPHVRWSAQPGHARWQGEVERD